MVTQPSLSIYEVYDFKIPAGTRALLFSPDALYFGARLLSV